MFDAFRQKILTVLLSALQESGISGLILSVETTFLISSKLGSGVTYWKQTGQISFSVTYYTS